MTKTIPLGNDLDAIVDDDDYTSLSLHSWSAVFNRNHTPYARRMTTIHGRDVGILMHRAITGATPDAEVDHLNGNTLDNRKDNLRVCQPALNRQRAGLRKNNKSGYRGVAWDNRLGKWRATISVDGKSHHLGCFDDKIEAALTYDRFATLYFGPSAKTNMPR